jgi:carbonic anhydrase
LLWFSDPTGSEHTINGNRAPLELHLVHFKSSYGTLGAAIASGVWAPCLLSLSWYAQASDALTVVGIAFRVGQFNRDLDPIINAAKDLEAGSTNIVNANFNLKKIVDDAVDGSTVYRYQFVDGWRDLLPSHHLRGSLTTPPCNPIVNWVVLSELQTISRVQVCSYLFLIDTESFQLLKFNRLKGEEDQGFETVIAPNFRPVQPLGGRTVNVIVGEQ